MLTDPYAQFVLLLAALAWSMIGAIFWAAFREESPGYRWVAFLIVFGGPTVWALAGWHGILHARRRALAHYGMEHYTCCGGHCGQYHRKDRA